MDSQHPTPPSTCHTVSHEEALVVALRDLTAAVHDLTAAMEKLQIVEYIDEEDSCPSDAS